MSGIMRADSLPSLMEMNLCLGGNNGMLPFVEPIRHELPVELRDRFYFDIHHILENFVRSAEARFKLPKNLTTHQKHYLLTVMQCMGLRLKSCKEFDAFVVKTSCTRPFARPLELAPDSRLVIMENQGLLEYRSGNFYSKEKLKSFSFRAVGVLTGGTPRVPKTPVVERFESHRESLPIYHHKAAVLKLINRSQVCVVTGPAGCGKSTQIPQYILEEAERTRTPVRILVACPTNVAVVALCERVSAERGESVGLTVGYQIPLESNSSPVETLLNFVSIPVFIRAMAMPGCQLLETTTHVIVDEIHLRSRYQDFLLLCLRDAILTRTHLKIILISEGYNVGEIVTYFGGKAECPQLSVSMDSFETCVYYLEDILRFTWNNELLGKLQLMYEPTADLNKSQRMQENALRFGVDVMIKNVFERNKVEENFLDFWNLARTGEVSIDYQHSVTSVTMVMAAAAAEHLDFVQTLVEAGADLSLRSKNDFTVFDWAEFMRAMNVVSYFRDQRVMEPRFLASSDRSVMDYIRHYDPTRPDMKMICRLIQMVHVNDASLGGILVFLTTYEDIMELKELICSSYKAHPTEWANKPFHLYFLHEYIQSGDQRAVFEKPRTGSRKVVLSTYLGESCFSFQDIQIIIDSGRPSKVAKGCKPFCPPSLAMRDGHWISKAEADSRMARVSHAAGGVCYRLYTRQCYEAMEQLPRPEVTSSALLDLCLQSRSLLRNEVNISDFFGELPTPPCAADVNYAVTTLKLAGALENDEQLSDLGVHLLDYNIDPLWAKAVILSVILKCMDPVLTIASCVSYGEPFLSFSHPAKREMSHQKKLKLSCRTQSDHAALLKAFEQWEEEKALRTNPGNSAFCMENYISPYTFEVAYDIRTHLVGQLRASGFIQTKGQSDILDINKHARNWPLVKAVLTASLHPNIAVVNRVAESLFDRDDNGGLRFSKDSVVNIEKPDWAAGIPSDWIIYSDKLTAFDGTEVIRGCSVVSPVNIALFAGDYTGEVIFECLSPPPSAHSTGFSFTSQERRRMIKELGTPGFNLDVDSWIRFFGFDPALVGLTKIKRELGSMVKRHLRNPECVTMKVEDIALNTAVAILAAEDARLGLKNINVGQWPKLVAGNLLSTSLAGFEVGNSGGP